MFSLISNFVPHFFECDVDSGSKWRKDQFATSGIKAGGSRAGVNLGLVDEGPIAYASKNLLLCINWT